jgi:hypothetical protein
MNNLTNEQKAKLYDRLIHNFQRLQEEARQIRSKSIDVSENDQKKINILELQMRSIENDAKKLF